MELKYKLMIGVIGLVTIAIPLIAFLTVQGTEHIYINTTIYINKTIVQNNTIIEYINTTEECDCPDAAYMSRLIRDYERCNAEMKYFNETDLKDLSYDLNISLTRCRQKVEDLKDLI